MARRIRDLLPVATAAQTEAEEEGIVEAAFRLVSVRSTQFPALIQQLTVPTSPGLLLPFCTAWLHGALGRSPSWRCAGAGLE